MIDDLITLVVINDDDLSAAKASLICHFNIEQYDASICE
jgi:hypothetical protein